MRQPLTSLTALTIAATAATLLGCSSSTEPRVTNVAEARALWLQNRPAEYVFEVSVASSWFPKSGYYRVRVSGGTVIAAWDPSGKPISTYALTVEQIWTDIDRAVASDELNSAVFNRRGVPVEIDLGEWSLDGGVHYSVRNFAPVQTALILH